jgi:hypothetical protein
VPWRRGNENLQFVGEIGLTTSPYGTFDQAGNAFEWTETYLDPGARRIRGGASVYSEQPMAASSGYANNSISEFTFLGFRVGSFVLPGDFNGDGSVDARTTLCGVTTMVLPPITTYGEVTSAKLQRVAYPHSAISQLCQNHRDLHWP